MPNKSSLILFILCILILLGSVLYVRYSAPKIINRVTVDTVRVTTMVPVYIHREKVITRYDTVYVDNHAFKTAYYSEIIDTNRVSGKLDVQYSELSGKFDIGLNLVTTSDTIYVNKTINNSIEAKYPLIGVIAGVNGLYERDRRYGQDVELAVDAGLRLFGKYDIEAIITTNKQTGIRIGTRF